MKQGVFGIALTTGIPSPTASSMATVEMPAAIETRSGAWPSAPFAESVTRLRHVLRFQAEDDDVGPTGRLGVVGRTAAGPARRRASRPSARVRAVQASCPASTLPERRSPPASARPMVPEPMMAIRFPVSIGPSPVPGKGERIVLDGRAASRSRRLNAVSRRSGGRPDPDDGPESARELRDEPGGIRLFAAGTAVGSRFEIRSVRGTGGSAVVYSAFDRDLKQVVALKVLRADRTSPAALARLRREVAIARQAASPRLIRVFDIDASGESVFLSMEDVEGGSLRERLAEGALPIEETLRIAGEILEGLAVLHGLGIVHRDVKPGNVLLAADGSVELADFGLARHFEADETRATRHGRHRRDGGVPVAGAGAREGPRRPERPLLLRDHALGDADGWRPVSPRLGRRNGPGPREGGGAGSRLRPAGRAGMAGNFRGAPSREVPGREVPDGGSRARRPAGATGDGDDRGSRPAAGSRGGGPPRRCGARRRSPRGASAASAARARRFAPRADGRGAVALDARGRALWERTDIPNETAILRFRRPGGRTGVAEVVSDPPDAGTGGLRIALLEPASGAVRRRSASRPPTVRTSGTCRPGGRSEPSKPSTRTAGTATAVLSLVDPESFPSAVLLVDPETAVSRPVLMASGHQVFLGSVDLDGDGKNELLFASAANRLGQYAAVAAVRSAVAGRMERTVEGARSWPVTSPDLIVFEDRLDSLAWYALGPAWRSGVAKRMEVDSQARVLRFSGLSAEPFELGFDGFPAKSRSALAPADRQARRTSAWLLLRRAAWLHGAGDSPGAAAAAAEAARTIAPAGDPSLLEWARRTEARLRVATGRADEGEQLFRAVGRDAVARISVEFDAARALHLSGELSRAISWYRDAVLGRGEREEPWILVACGARTHFSRSASADASTKPSPSSTPSRWPGPGRRR